MGSKYAIGRDIHVGDTIMGIKKRRVGSGFCEGSGCIDYRYILIGSIPLPNGNNSKRATR
jgi:hypothetical protein